MSLLTEKPKNQKVVMPRYFVAKANRDVIILDIEENNFYWKSNLSDSEYLELFDEKINPLIGKSPTKFDDIKGGLTREINPINLYDISLIFEAIYSLCKCGFSVRKGYRHIFSRMNSLADLSKSLNKTCNLSSIISAMQIAQLLFPVEVKCLQRSMALTIMARRHGYPINLLIGANGLPFRGHAWVQYENKIINDSAEKVLQFRPLLQLPYEL